MLIRFSHLYFYVLILTVTVTRSSDIEDIYIYGSVLEQDYMGEPSSLSLRGSQDFYDYNTDHLEEILQTIPNLNFAKGSNRSRFFQVRGIGERPSYEGMPNHSVGVLLDDIDYSGVGGVYFYLFR